jgi:protocatechuate 3,4-dioxygenase beta subunit
MRIGILLLAAFQVIAQNLGSLEGTVVDSVSHLPVKKARVLIWPAFTPDREQGGGSRPAKPKAVMTDAGGAFSIRDLTPGAYMIQLAHPRYPQSWRSQTVEVKPGPEPAPVSFEMAPGASVTGRVVDPDGDPIEGCIVHVRSPAASGDGFILPGVLGIRASDDNGEYRVWGIQPGKYIAMARCDAPVFEPRPLSPGPPLPPARAYAPQFYPAGADAKSAATIELAPGMEKSGVDFRMTPARVYTINGRVSSGEPFDARHLMIFLRPANRAERYDGELRPADFDREKSAFTFPRVFPGSYVIVAFVEGDPEGRFATRRRVDVSDRSVDVDLALLPAADLGGTVRMESGEELPKSLTIQVLPLDSPGPNQPAPAEVAADGRFTFKSVPPGLWKVQTFGPGTAFIKSVAMAGQEQSGSVVDTSTGGGQLTIVLSTQTATVRGTAAPGCRIRATFEPDGEMFERREIAVMSDAGGVFQFTGLAPGKYRIYAEAASGETSQNDGRIVTVHEGETVTVDLQ